MSAEPEATNALSPSSGARSVKAGDVPEVLERRYFTDGRGGVLGFYVDAKVKAPAFRDRGRELITAYDDPNAIRDMVAIARHRSWSTVTLRGGEAFRREAWLTARSAGLEARGYHPTERDRQDLERRTRRRQRALPDERGPPGLGGAGAKSRLDVIESVVRSRVDDRAAQNRIVSAARGRIADWLERGARFDVMPLARGAPERHRSHGRER